MIREYFYQPIKEESYADTYARLYKNSKEIKQITFQITEDCCLACTYCYQNAKTHKTLDFTTIQKIIDELLENKNEYINLENTDGLIIEFIGGEPLLEITIIQQTIEYFLSQAIIKHHPWAFQIHFSICSNGILYFDKQFQTLLKNYSHFIGYTISIDGDKQLHDSCRIDKNGNGSYDKAISAAKHYMHNYNPYLATKMTLSPQNIKYLYNSIINLINLGYTQIWANCVYEDVWTLEDAQLLYIELKKIADYLLNNNLYNKVFFRMLEEQAGHPLDINNNDNFCGGCYKNGEIKNIAVGTDGKFYPCIRYMESSLNNKQKPLYIGSVESGFLQTEQEKNNYQLLCNVTRRSQSSDECFFCPIASECGSCSAYNYEIFGTPNKKSTFICMSHKARVLANIYYWNQVYKKLNINEKKEILLSKEEALKIISEQEYNLLLNI